MFNKALESVVPFHDNTFVLQLIKVWNPSDSTIYSADYSRFTNDSYAAYWMAIDATVKFADTILFKMKKNSTQNQTIKQSNRPSRDRIREKDDIHRHSPDKYHWSSKSYSNERHRKHKRSDISYQYNDDSRRRHRSVSSLDRLPTPPPMYHRT